MSHIVSESKSDSYWRQVSSANQAGPSHMLQLPSLPVQVLDVNASSNLKVNATPGAGERFDISSPGNRL